MILFVFCVCCVVLLLCCVPIPPFPIIINFLLTLIYNPDVFNVGVILLRPLVPTPHTLCSSSYIHVPLLCLCLSILWYELRRHGLTKLDELRSVSSSFSDSASSPFLLLFSLFAFRLALLHPSPFIPAVFSIPALPGSIFLCSMWCFSGLVDGTSSLSIMCTPLFCCGQTVSLLVPEAWFSCCQRVFSRGGVDMKRCLI